MFKEENRIWFYLLGILIMFGVLLLLNREVYFPVLYESDLSKIQISLNTSKPIFNLDPNLDYSASFITSEGAFVVDLFENNAPENVNNFVYLSNIKYYSGTKFHRIIPSTLIQGGDRNSLSDNGSLHGKGNPGYFITDEINLNTLSLTTDQIATREAEGFGGNTNLSSVNANPYFLAMANTGKPNTNGSQFFIILPNISSEDLNKINGRFTIIGGVVSGQDVIRKFNEVELTETKNYLSPTQPITIQSIEINSI